MRASKLGAVRTVFALLCLAAWFALSNHCGLERLLNRSAMTAGCPHCAGDGQGKPSPLAMGDCCRHLKVTSERVQPFQPAHHLLATMAFQPLAMPLAPSAECVALPATGTGPPGLLSFAEMVLQRSLPAHAPPFLA